MKKILFLCVVVLLFSCKTVDKKFLVSRIQSAAKLATTEVVLNKIVWSELKNDKVFGKLSNKNVILFNSEATIKLGIDLKKISAQNVLVRNDSVILSLPPIELISFDYPHEKYEQIYPVSNFNTIRRKDKVEKLDEVFRLAEKDIRSKIKLLNLEEQAEENTIRFLSGFLQNSGYQHVHITFQTKP